MHIAKMIVLALALLTVVSACQAGNTKKSKNYSKLLSCGVRVSIGPNRISGKRTETFSKVHSVLSSLEKQASKNATHMKRELKLKRKKRTGEKWGVLRLKGPKLHIYIIAYEQPWHAEYTVIFSSAASGQPLKSVKPDAERAICNMFVIIHKTNKADKLKRALR